MKARLICCVLKSEEAAIHSLLRWQQIPTIIEVEPVQCFKLTEGSGKPVVQFGETNLIGYHQTYNYLNQEGLFQL